MEIITPASRLNKYKGFGYSTQENPDSPQGSHEVPFMLFFKLIAQKIMSARPNKTIKPPLAAQGCPRHMS